jgi:hypothetical protein
MQVLAILTDPAQITMDQIIAKQSRIARAQYTDRVPLLLAKTVVVALALVLVAQQPTHLLNWNANEDN